MLDPFFLNSLLAGVGVALMCGPMGCFIAWMRLAYYGDTIGHAALLGVVLSILFSVDPAIAIIMLSIIIAVILFLFTRMRMLASDTVLGVLAHGGLALGVVLMSLWQMPVDVQAYLFGDILAVGTEDVILIYSAAAVSLLLIAANWRSLMLMVVSKEIAHVEGVNVQAQRLMLMVLIAIVVAVSIKIVGLLLVTSMLIIPAAAARSFALSPHGMAFLSTFFGIVAALGGMAASFHADTPTGPSIILAAIVIFASSWGIRLLLKWRSRGRGQTVESSHAHP